MIGMKGILVSVIVVIVILAILYFNQVCQWDSCNFYGIPLKPILHSWLGYN